MRKSPFYKLGPFNWFGRFGSGGVITPQIITADTAPTMSALTDAQTPADGYTAGTYSSTAGTIASAVATYYVNGNTGTSSDDLDPDDTVYVSVLVTDSEGNTRTFTTATVTVTAAPVATLTLTADDPAFTAGSGGNPAQIDFTIVYDGADDLTGYLVTSDSASPPSAAEVIAGSGTGIIEGISWSETEGSLDLTGLTALSNGDKYLYIVIKEDAGDAVSGVLSITATGLDFTNPAHSSAATDAGGTTVTATMTESMVGTEATGDWVVKVGGSAITVSAVSISGTDIALTVSPAIANGDTVTYSYSGGDLEDAQGNPLGAITDQAVTNNVAGQTIVFALAGQSNMVGQGAPDGGGGYPAGTLQVARTGGSSGGADGALVAAAEPLDHGNTGGGMSLAVEFVREYVAAHPNDTVVLVPCASNGTGFVDNRWNPGDDLYNALVSRVNTLMTANPDFVFGGLLWHQGEKDAAASVASATYIADLTDMLDSLVTDISAMTASTPVVLGGLPVVSVERNSGTFKEIQAALFAFAAGRSYCDIADSRYPVPAARMLDNFHWDAFSLREIGRRYAEAYERAASDASYSASGPAVAINLPGAEAGALRHWLLGADNASDTDLVYGGVLAAQGDVALSRGTGFLSLPGREGSGLHADVFEGADVTICAVLRRTAGSFHIPLGQMYVASYASTEWGITSNDRFYKPDNSFASLAQADTLNTFYFYAVSLSSGGIARAYTSNGGSPSSLDTTVAARNLSAQPVPLTIGPGLYHSTETEAFNGDLDVAEVIIFDGVKTMAELATIYGNSQTRLASRGVTVA